jgi:anti-sigma regulatory factor (Ser/Thr protein kinase)
VSVHREFRPEPVSAQAARDSLEKLASVIPSHKLEDARLAVSELVTNSLRHAKLSPEDGRICLRVEAAEGLLKGEVCDTGLGFELPAKTPPDGFLEGGWGLYLVDTVCERWGVEKTEVFCVWFEIEF